MTETEAKDNVFLPGNPKNKAIPNEVAQQLSSSFVPAMRTLSQAANDLLKAYQLLQKNSETFEKSLLALSYTGKTALPPGKSHARNLAQLSKKYKQVIDAHQKPLADFTAFVQKTGKYSEEEKDKIKKMHNTFKKEEKDLQKLHAKGQKNDVDLANFYATYANQFQTQQERRYKFFHDRTAQWFASYKDMIAPFVETAVAAAEVPPTTSVPVSVVSNGEVSHQHSEAESHNQHHEESTPVTPPAQEAPFVSIVAVPHEENGDNDSTKSRASTVISSVHRLPSRRQSGDEATGIVLVNHTKRNSIQPPPPPPVVNEDVVVAEAVESRQRTISAQTEIMVPPAPAPRKETIPPAKQAVIPAPVRVVHPRNYSQDEVDTYAVPVRAKPMSNGYSSYDRQSIVDIDNEFQPNGHGRLSISVNQPLPRVQDYNNGGLVRERPRSPIHSQPIQYENARQAPQVNGRISPRPAPIQYQPPPAQHQIQPQQQQTSPVQQQPNNVYVKPIFTNSDLNRVLIVNKDFNSNSNTSLTVNRGDRVTLIANGSRGWVFIQEIDSQRTGWIPAHNVEILHQ